MSENTCELVPLNTPDPDNASSDDSNLNEIVESAFSTGLAAAIMSEFPVASILAISRGQKGKRLVAQADEITEKTGIRGGAKRMLAKIFSIYGFINGIACTVLYSYLAFLLILQLSMYFLFFMVFIFSMAGILTQF